MDEGEWSGVEVVGGTGRSRHGGEGEARIQGRRRALGRRRRAASLGGRIHRPRGFLDSLCFQPLCFLLAGERYVGYRVPLSVQTLR